MLGRLRKNLTLLCSLFTGLVLLVMVLLCLRLSEAQIKRANQAAFTSNINSITYRLSTDSIISSLWLSQMEASERLLIRIEDNGQAFKFLGSWQPATDRESLFAAVREKARQDGVDTRLRPISLLENTSWLSELYGTKGERYLAAVVLIPTKTHHLTLFLLRDMSSHDMALFQQRLLFGGIGLASVFLLFGFSWWFTGKALVPVERSQKKQVEFVAAASHELRSPLAVVQASLSAMRAAPDEMEKFTLNIDRECSRMGRLVEDLLLLAGADAKNWDIRTETIDLDTLLIETYETFASLYTDRISFTLPDDPLPPIQGDAQRLRQVLSVLIDNALSHTKEGTRINLHAWQSVSVVCIEVADNGEGIPEQAQAHIFDRFYRADQSRNSKSHFGLGLPIARELTRLHGGKLYLKSSGPEGTIFHVELPVRGK